MSFGERLRALREEKGFTQTQLAEKSDLDVTTISRLERGQGRPPRPATVNKLVAAFGWSSDDPRVAALESELAIVATRATRHSASANAEGKDTRFSGVMDQVASFRDRSSITTAVRQPRENHNPQKLPTEPHVLDGLDEVHDMAIRLLEAVEPLARPHSSEILLTFQGEQDSFYTGGRLVLDGIGQWDKAKLHALEHGWDIVHLVRLRENNVKAFDTIKSTFQLLGALGSYIPHYFTESEILTPVYDLLLVPGKGGLLLFSTKNEHHIDTAFFYPPGPHIKALVAHFYLLKAQTEPILTRYGSTHWNDLEFLAEITRAEEREGERYLIMDGLSEVTVPMSITEERARNIKAENDEQREAVRTLLKHRRRRWTAFHENLRRWSCRDICPKSAIRRMVEEGRYSPDDSLVDLGAPPETPNQVLEHLELVLDLVENYPNYELGLLDDVPPSVQHTFALCKRRHIVLVETHTSDERDKAKTVELALAITEPSVIEAFRPYFLSIWDSLPPANKDKHQVADWLRQQMEGLRRRIALGEIDPPIIDIDVELLQSLRQGIARGEVDPGSIRPSAER